MVTQASGFEAPWEDLIEFWHLSLWPLDLFHLCLSFGIMSMRLGLNNGWILFGYWLKIGWTLVELTSRGKSILWNCLSGWESMKATFMNKLLPSFEIWLNGIIFKIKEMIKYFDISLAQNHSRLVIDNLKFTKYILTDKVVQPPNSIWSNLQKKVYNT